MEEQVIQTKRGTFGRVQVTLPMNVKNTILDWRKHSGMGKAEFFRVSFLIGASILAGSLNARKPNVGYISVDEDDPFCALPDVRKEGAKDDFSQTGVCNE